MELGSHLVKCPKFITPFNWYFA